MVDSLPKLQFQQQLATSFKTTIYVEQPGEQKLKSMCMLMIKTDSFHEKEDGFN
jgi:hypothetical protein